MKTFALVVALLTAGFGGAAQARNDYSPLPLRLAQADSCSARMSLCIQRCSQLGPKTQECIYQHCYAAHNECLQSGCWTDSQPNGGNRTCGLAK